MIGIENLKTINSIIINYSFIKTLPWVLMNSYVSTLILGLILVVVNLIIPPGEGSYWGIPVPAWGGRIIVIIGSIISLISLICILLGKGKKSPADTDEDVQQAKADLERMYLRDHGELPRYPEKEKEKTEEQQGL